MCSRNDYRDCRQNSVLPEFSGAGHWVIRIPGAGIAQPRTTKFDPLRPKDGYEESLYYLETAITDVSVIRSQTRKIKVSMSLNIRIVNAVCVLGLFYELPL